LAGSARLALMDIEIRYARADEFGAIADVDGANFGIHYTPQQLADAQLDVNVEHILVAVVDGRIVGLSAELPFAMALPGGGQVRTTGLTWVSVEVTHRRRGIVRALLEQQVRDARDRGISALILSASEGGIYGRYGFGVATYVRHSVVQRRRARIAQPVDAGAVRRLSTADARDLLPDLYERWRRASPGGVSRDARRWELLLLDRDYQRGGRSGLFHLVHPDGYFSYRIKENWNNGDPQHECLITDYAPITADAHAALWQTLLALDLVGTIESYRVPLDDSLPLLLEDPRGMDTRHLGDNLWVRPIDVAALLGSRRYGLDVRCVLEVRDDLLGDRRYLVQGGPDGGSCTPTDAAADVVLSVADVGALCLGGVRLQRLARAGRAAVNDLELLRRLDLALLADREPAHGTSF
jgi:predicted acetyltransferase